MDKYTFLVEIFTALSWPAVVLIVVFSLRRSLVSLIPSLENLRYKELELKFSREIKQLQREIPDEVDTVTGEQISHSEATQSERLGQLVEMSPRLAIIEAWRLVELSAVEILRKLSNKPSVTLHSTSDLLNALKDNGFVKGDVYRFLQRLLFLRNRASHSSDFAVAEEDARRYTHNSLSVVVYLKSRETEVSCSQ